MMNRGKAHATPRTTQALATHLLSASPAIAAKPFPDWRTIQVPENEDGYPDPRPLRPTPSKGLFIRHLKNIEVSHVEITSSAPDPRPAVWLEDVHRAVFFAFTASSQPNFGLHHVTDFRVLWSRAAKDTTLATVADRLL